MKTIKKDLESMQGINTETYLKKEKKRIWKKRYHNMSKDNKQGLKEY